MLASPQILGFLDLLTLAEKAEEKQSGGDQFAIT